MLPVSARGEVLLLQGRDPARPDDLHWVSIGGAVDPGESPRRGGAARAPGGDGHPGRRRTTSRPRSHRGSHAFSWDGVDYLSHATFFAMRAGRTTPRCSFDGLEPPRSVTSCAPRWWSPDALAADGTAASPDLPEIMTTAIVAVRGEM